MKKLKYFFLLLALAGSMLFYSCDDAGTVKPFTQKGLVSFTHSNLKPLNPNVDSLYVLWLGLGPAPGITWYDLGHFNISAAGEIVDSLGNTKNFAFSGDTNILGDATVASVTLGYNPNYKVLISGSLSVNSDSVAGNLRISGDLALGSVGKRILGEGFTKAFGSEILRSPSTNNANCRQGVWFCDSLGNRSFSDGLGLTPGKGWVYQGWLLDGSSNQYYSTGRFYNFDNPDFDGAGPCAGPNPGFNKPGQDFVVDNPPTCLSIPSITSGSFGVIITLEPEVESAGISTPFFVKVFWRVVIAPSAACSINYPYLTNQYATMPVGNIHITN